VRSSPESSADTEGHFARFVQWQLSKPKNHVATLSDVYAKFAAAEVAQSLETEIGNVLLLARARESISVVGLFAESTPRPQP